MVRAVKSPAPPSATRFRRAVSPTSRHQAAPLCINSPPRCSLHLPRASAPLTRHGGSSSIATNREWPSSPHAPASKLPSHREPPSSPHAPASKLPGHREPPHPRGIKSPLRATVASPSNRRSLAPLLLSVLSLRRDTSKVPVLLPPYADLVGGASLRAASKLLSRRPPSLPLPLRAPSPRPAQAAPRLFCAETLHPLHPQL